MNELTISQSLIKFIRYDELGEAQCCPRKLKLEFAEGVRRDPSLAMMQGNYFETQLLGANRDGTRTDDLPTTPKTGQKTTTHYRIDDMVQVILGEVVPEYGLDLSGAHQKLIHEMPGLEFRLEANLDLVTPILDPTLDPMNKQELAIVDIKLTEDLGNTFGDFCWGRPERMKLLQAHFYKFVFKESQGREVPFYYLVAEHGPGRRWKVFRKETKAVDQQELIITIRRTDAQLVEWSDNDFPIKPNYHDCSTCPLATACPGYTIGRSVEII